MNHFFHLFHFLKKESICKVVKLLALKAILEKSIFFIKKVVHVICSKFSLYETDSWSFRVSSTSMWPGACVMQNAGLDFITIAWGVTPHAQNTGISPSCIVTASPKSGLFMSAIPIRVGSPMCTGLPWTRGYLAVISVAQIASLAVKGLIDTTNSPWNLPALLHCWFVLYIGTLHLQEHAS